MFPIYVGELERDLIKQTLPQNCIYLSKTLNKSRSIELIVLHL